MKHTLIEATEAARQEAEQRAAEVVVNTRPIGAYADLRKHPRHYTHTLDDLVGYVVRETVGADNVPLWRDEQHQQCGYDVAVITAGNRYAEAIEVAGRYRKAGRYAVVDSLYLCGCRS